eukprot:gnl/MRDRNA2_/MRDRNA2_108831_c0_seq1.p1 gnl/MRDRNA2_/MRDRNA2_108831_c0~~gnl/MRDRNA2_/MRDRNA2_108831_c0_seq1.p1  ORF type:complete len:598 (-),score=99.16 gnl/MRDRNA2_/MRDRNA2_108831_c0_seq1:8-1801(-)
MQLNVYTQSKKMGSVSRIASPPLTLLTVLFSVEALISFLGLKSQYIEAWLVIVIVPLALLLSQGSRPHKASTGKVTQHVRWNWKLLSVFCFISLIIWQVTSMVHFTVQGSFDLALETKSAAKLIKAKDSIGQDWKRFNQIHTDSSFKFTHNVNRFLGRVNQTLKIARNVKVPRSPEEPHKQVFRLQEEPKRTGGFSGTLNSKLKKLMDLLDNSRKHGMSEALELLAHVCRYEHTEWTDALSANFSSDYVYRGRVGGGRALEKDKLSLAGIVSKLQEKHGQCGGPAIVPQTLPLRNQSEQRDFCEKVASNCGQQKPMWVTKPRKSVYGIGISLQNFTGHDSSTCLSSLNKLDQEKTPNLAQEFIGEPLTVDGNKVELRYHVMIANVKPYLVLYHPEFVVKKAGKSSRRNKEKVFNVNSHQQKVVSFTAEELVQALGLNEQAGQQALELIRAQLRRITRLVITAQYQEQGFAKDESLRKPGPWEVYGCDVALTKDFRAYLLDWNYSPGLGFNVKGAASHRASTIRDMYRIVLQKLRHEPPENLAAFASQTSWKVAIDETSGGDDAFPNCSKGNWQADLPGTHLELVQSWAVRDAQTTCQ